jgi:hypothetical protein
MAIFSKSQGIQGSGAVGEEMLVRPVPVPDREEHRAAAL